MYFVPHPPSLYFDHPLDCTILCSSVLDSTPVLKEDRSIDGFGVEKPTCVAIHEEYDWELGHSQTLEDNPCLSTPPPFVPDILSNPAIPDFSYVSLSMDAPIIHHSQGTPDVSPSSDNGDDQSFIKHLLDFSSIFSGNAKYEDSFFSSTPLRDSSNLEDADQHLEFFDLGYCDLGT